MYSDNFARDWRGEIIRKSPPAATTASSSKKPASSTPPPIRELATAEVSPTEVVGPALCCDARTALRHSGIHSRPRRRPCNLPGRWCGVCMGTERRNRLYERGQPVGRDEIGKRLFEQIAQNRRGVVTGPDVAQWIESVIGASVPAQKPNWRFGYASRFTKHG